MDDELAYRLALLLTPGAGPVTVNRAVEVVGSDLRELVGLDVAKIVNELPPGQESTARILSQCGSNQLDRAIAQLDRLAQAGCTLCALDDESYPDSVKRALGNSAPPILFCWGEAHLLDALPAAIVGARDASEAGLILTEECAGTLINGGAVIVSGGAPGVDSMAHTTAIHHPEGTTIFVLPEGILSFKMTRPIRDAVESGKVLLVSQFFPEARWTTQAAFARNRTIAAWSSLICAIEPGSKGGTRSTVDAGLEFGKDTLVYCRGGHHKIESSLLRQGARSILNETHEFDRGYLEKQWKLSLNRSRGQSELF
jgi:predicted Rossmann fold nucleotide-binding protein DprA/Smf involved in DNA uptake